MDKETNNCIYFLDYLVFKTFLCSQFFLESKRFKDIANKNIEHETKKNTYKKIAYTNITNILTRTNQSNEIWTYVLNNRIYLLKPWF